MKHMLKNHSLPLLPCLLALLLLSALQPFSPSAFSSSSPTLQPDTQAYMKRCRESSKWDAKFTHAADRFIARAKAAGWWR